MSTIKDRSFTPEQFNVMRNKATQAPHFGESNSDTRLGTYLCRACGSALFRAEAHFISGCGWPSFDAALINAVLEQLDEDGLRHEIVCAHCEAHLGHVFDGEGFTLKNRRYCVNAVSLDFVTHQKILDTEEAIIAGGCFWGVEHYLHQLSGVVKTEVGYTGGTVSNPAYDMVCSGKTEHLEAVRIVYQPDLIDYEAVLNYFFETHDPTQSNGQGPDIGSQYHSAIFYYTLTQKQTAQRVIATLQERGYAVVTKLLPVSTFWQAEPYHQHYYARTHKTPYCHVYVKRF